MKRMSLRKIRGTSDIHDQDVRSRTLRGMNECSNKEGFKGRKFLVGVDEAGRGPLAGPVAVGVVIIPNTFKWRIIPGVGDSKQVSVKNREAIFDRAKVLQREHLLDFSVSLVSASTIDRIGITKAVALGIQRSLKKLEANPKKVSVKLDGLLSAPSDFRFQETIIRGDAKEKVIGLASILAKVTRDRHMERMGKVYPGYGFEIHKGYGTLLHRKNIRNKGLSPIHRKYFCTKVLM